MNKLTIVIAVFVVLVLLLSVSAAGAGAPGTNVDPFGGLPVFDANSVIQQGGVPSALSGDGSTPRAAIYIANDCATMKFTAGKATWFKLDAWSNKRQQIWLDDELADATVPSGSAVWGAADKYMLGNTPGGAWNVNAYPQADFQNANFINGFVMAIYDPDSLRPLNTFAPPNAAILSVNVDKNGFLQNSPFNVKIADAVGARIHGFANYNKMQPSHLLWYEANFAGWVFVQVYDQMIWDNNASVCAKRVFQ
jgi:hypothetical protein